MHIYFSATWITEIIFHPSKYKVLVSQACSRSAAKQSKDVHELGKIESYEFGNSAEEKTAGHIDNDLEDSFDWDWAVIRISSGLHLPNSIGNLGTNSDDIVATVEDYVRSDDLTTGMVLIQSGMSGTQSGTLYADSILMLLEDKCLELMEIEMKHPLSN